MELGVEDAAVQMMRCSVLDFEPSMDASSLRSDVTSSIKIISLVVVLQGWCLEDAGKREPNVSPSDSEEGSY